MGAKIEEVLLHSAAGIGTADFEIVQVDHDVDALAALLEGASGGLQHRRPLHLPRLDGGRGCSQGRSPRRFHKGGETPWVRLAKEEWGEKFEDAGLLARAADGVHVGGRGGGGDRQRTSLTRAPTRLDSPSSRGHALPEPAGLPSRGFGELQWESIYLEQNEYKELAAGDDARARRSPARSRPSLRCPGGGFPHLVSFQDHRQIASVRAFRGLLDRSLMEGIVAGQRDYQDKIKPLPPEEQRAVLAEIADSMQPGLPPGRTGASSARSTSSSGAATSRRSGCARTARAPTSRPA